MTSEARIEKGLWWDISWNPVTGCTPISGGCKNCWARSMANRLKGRCGYPEDEPFRPGTLHPDKLNDPLHWHKPRRIFVSSMGDLFHENVANGFRDKVFAAMAACGRHTFMLLTKRPQVMANYISMAMCDEECSYQGWYEELAERGIPDASPLQNVWLGVSVENQRRADERIPILLQIPAAVRFVSYEPALGPLELETRWTHHDIKPPYVPGTWRLRRELHWVIAGCESGSRRRPAPHDWFRQLRDECKAAGVPFFLKQMGEKENGSGKVIHAPYLDGRQWLEMPTEIPHEA